MARRSVLAEPAIVGARRVALDLLDDFDKAWRDLTNPKDDDGELDASRDALHDLRVALRTLRSWLRAVDDLVPVPKGVRRRLKRVASATGPGRDAEVLLERLNGFEQLPASAFDAAHEWSEVLTARAADVDWSRYVDDVEKATARLRALLQRVRWAGDIDAEPWWEHRLGSALSHLIDVQAGVLAGAFDDFLEAASPGSDALDDHASRLGHQLRIEGKRVRYLIEPIRGEISSAEAVLPALRELQDAFGELHDVHVALAALEEFRRERGRIGKKPPPASSAGTSTGIAALASAIRGQERTCLAHCERVVSTQARSALFAHIARCAGELDAVARRATPRA